MTEERGASKKPATPRGSRIARAPNVVAAASGERVVLIDGTGGTRFGVNELGRQIWEILGDAPTFPELVARLAVEYEVRAETLAHDVALQVERMREAGLVHWR
ncbi:MAG: PqqD family protein [Gemmatimonadaceae bacterium]